jgi:hypothetical protein
MRKFFPKSLLLFFCLVLLGGCTTPVVKIKVVDDRPGISIHGVPGRAIVYVNGLSMGRAEQYGQNGKVLLLEPGIHEVEIVRKGTIIFTQRVLLGRGPQKIYMY